MSASETTWGHRARRSVSLGLALAAALAAGCGPQVQSVTAPGYDTHADYFPLQGTAHEGVDCNSCHGAFDTFTKFDCLTCHTKAETDPIHSGVGGYQYDSPACVQCHKDGSFAHTLFPIGSKTSHAASCSGCHGSAKKSDLNGLKCASCHATRGVDAKHSGILDYSASSPSCLRCHDQSKVARVASHPSGESTFRGNWNHPERCLTCHPGILASPANSAGATWAADWKSQGCNSCHSGGFGD